MERSLKEHEMYFQKYPEKSRSNSPLSIGRALLPMKIYFSDLFPSPSTSKTPQFERMTQDYTRQTSREVTGSDCFVRSEFHMRRSFTVCRFFPFPLCNLTRTCRASSGTKKSPGERRESEVIFRTTGEMSFVCAGSKIRVERRRKRKERFNKIYIKLNRIRIQERKRKRN